MSAPQAAAAAEAKQKGKAQRKEIFKRAEAYVKEYRAQVRSIYFCACCWQGSRAVWVVGMAVPLTCKWAARRRAQRRGSMHRGNAAGMAERQRVQQPRTAAGSAGIQRMASVQPSLPQTGAMQDGQCAAWQTAATSMAG